MKVSLGAGLLFIAVLAAVFVPKGLQYGQPPHPTALLSLRSSAPFVVEVVEVNVVKPLGEFQVELNITGEGQATLNVGINPLAVGAWPSPPNEIVSFADVDGDGGLSSGDAFTVRPQAGYSSYRLLVFHESAFVNPEPGCPCVAARLVFP